MRLIFSLLFFSLPFPASFVIPGMKALRQMFLSFRFSFSPSGGCQHILLDDFYTEYLQENANENLMEKRIAIYTMIYMLHQKTEQNKPVLMKMKAYLREDEEADITQLQQTISRVENMLTDSFYYHVNKALACIHSSLVAPLYTLPNNNCRLSENDFLTMSLCNLLRVRHELNKALGEKPPEGKSAEMEKVPPCKTLSDAKESVENNWQLILDLMLSDLMHFFTGRKKLCNFFNAVRKRNDYNELQAIGTKFVKLFGFPRMAMISNAHHETLGFLFSFQRYNDLYAQLYESFFEANTKVGRWRARIVLETFLYGEWAEDFLGNESQKISTGASEFSELVQELVVNVIDQLRFDWLLYSKLFWHYDKKIRLNVENFARNGKVSKISERFLADTQMYKQMVSEKKNVPLMWENGPEDVTLLNVLAISEQKWEMTGETSGKNEGSDENSTKSAETRRSLDEMINPKQNLTVISDHCLPFLNNAIETDFFEFKVKKVSKFSDDNYLKAMYQKLIDLIKSENSEKISKIENPTIKSLLRVLDIGIYVNQIYQRIKAANQLKEVAEKQHFQLDPSQKFSNHFDGILSTISKIDLSKGTDMRHLLKTVHLELKQLIIGPISAEEKGKRFNRQKIFGTVQFEHSKKNGCQNGSLYCILCNNLHTLSIQKYEKDEHLSVPTLKMVFMGVHILIPFIFVPILKHLPIGKYNAKQVERIGKIMAQKIENLLANDNLDEAQHKFEWIKRNEQMQEKNEALSKASKEKAVEIEEEIRQMLSIEMLMEEHKRNALINREKVKEMKAMLTILSDYGSDIKILNFLLTDNEIGTDQIAKESKKLSLFLQANAYLEQWAKNKNIYSTEMGFLDTKMLKIMLTKVFLLYPTASSLPFIIHKFFLTFSTWHWPLPVQLEMVNANQKNSGAILIWSPGREWTKKQTLAPNGLRKVLKRVLTMPIIRPMFPEENLGQEINLLNAQVIRWKMREAIIHLWHGNDLSALNEELNKPTEFIDTVFEQFSVNF
ncbi:hypothetical protein niasHS_007714 [Heterodera schachtii]|uniref:polynucleotide adenylyltransferase n=1 Tax=Heterodera schachtii TaxID=97005 RepID=A0ABD2JPF7_HETSC